MVAHCTASLRVSAAALTCAELTALLPVPPDACHERGSRYSTHPRSGIRGATLWLLESALPYAAALEDHLRGLLDRLGPAGVAALAALPEGCEADAFCLLMGAEPGDAAKATLDADLLRDLAAAGAELVLDVYPPPSPVAEPFARVTYGAATAAHARAADGLTALLDAGVAPGGAWRVTYVSPHEQGSVEVDAPLLRRLAGLGAPLTVALPG